MNQFEGQRIQKEYILTCMSHFGSLDQICLSYTQKKTINVSLPNRRRILLSSCYSFEVKFSTFLKVSRYTEKKGHKEANKPIKEKGRKEKGGK